MLLFKPEHVPLIKAGVKTQTRRWWMDKKTGKLREKPRCLVGKVHLAKTVMLSKEYFAKLLILRTWKEKLGDISVTDVYAEGYPNKSSYFLAFFTINKIKKIDRPKTLKKEIWCVSFMDVM